MAGDPTVRSAADPEEIDMSNAKPNVWRLTLECGHLRLDGPWDQKTPRHLIGDITWCEVCPFTTNPAGEAVMHLRQVLNVEEIPAALFREPDDVAARARMDQLQERLRPRPVRAVFG